MWTEPQIPTKRGTIFFHRWPEFLLYVHFQGWVFNVIQTSGFGSKQKVSPETILQVWKWSMYFSRRKICLSSAIYQCDMNFLLEEFQGLSLIFRSEKDEINGGNWRRLFVNVKSTTGRESKEQSFYKRQKKDVCCKRAERFCLIRSVSQRERRKGKKWT